eukprot:5078316-Ditylum_brightwellii.AAC.1
MKINLQIFETANHTVRNRHLPIPFYVTEKKDKLSHSDYQFYKLCTNYKDSKSAVYLLAVGIYEVGTLA